MNSPDKDSRKKFADTLHQLNQPLTAINNYAQAGSALLAAGQVDPDRLRELFDKIAGQSARTFDISRELREFGNSVFPADE